MEDLFYNTELPVHVKFLYFSRRSFRDGEFVPCRNRVPERVSTWRSGTLKFLLQLDRGESGTSTRRSPDLVRGVVVLLLPSLTVPLT